MAQIVLKPQTLNRKPCTKNGIRYMGSFKVNFLKTLYPKLCTLHPTPQTLDHKPYPPKRSLHGRF
jgi:hypothetical protein